MLKRTLVLALSIALSQAACVAPANDPGDEIADNEESVGENAEALSGDNLTWANACISKTQSLRTSIGRTKGTNIVSAATKEPTYSGATYGDCAWKEASYDSTHGAHAAHTANLYHCLGTQNECVNWSPNAGETVTQMVNRCVQAWFNEGPGGGHYTNMTSTTYTNLTCGVYKSSTGKYTVTADYKAAY